MSAASRYKRVALIGEGGMAQVFLTLSEELGASKLAVVKQLRPELAKDEEHRAMFLDEARLAVRLMHPNIVQTFEVGERDGLYFMAMEYLEGQPLNLVLQRVGREEFPAPLHLHVLVDVLRGLSYAHELVDFSGKPLAVVHRDVSPHNVFLTYDGQVKVVDFGIAKAQSSAERTKTGVFKGKPTYASPEQALGEAVDQRADVYSVGVMLWEAVARRRMWADRADMSVLMDLVNGRRPKLQDVAPNAPPALVEICERALQQAPEDRYATSREFLEALEAYVQAQPSRATSKDLGALVSDLFGSERERIRSTIEAQVQLPESGVQPAFGGVRTPTPPTLLQLAGITSLVTASGDRARPAAPAGRGTRRWAIGAVVASVAVAAAWVGMRSSNRADAREAATATASTAAAPTHAASSNAALTTVKVQVHTDPDGASVTLDGKPFDPSLGLPRDSAAHHLSVSAPGFEARTVDVALNEDQNLSVALRPVPAVSSGAAPQTGPGRGSVGKATAARRSGGDGIDEESPYKR